MLQRVVAVPAVCMVALPLLAGALARYFAPASNTSRETFDAIVVLGMPADADGNATPRMRDRVTEAVHEYERGVAPRLVMTGGAAHNRSVEASAMARVAEAQGVPASSILQETQALDTVQNACFSTRILKSHGWRSAEVVSSPSHLPRAALIFSRLPIEWRVHAAPESLTPGWYRRAAQWVEVLKTARYLIWSRRAERCSP
jgi:uncharacterized SAM-binding protein YcdF (DUF218 family)